MWGWLVQLPILKGLQELLGLNHLPLVEVFFLRQQSQMLKLAQATQLLTEYGASIHSLYHTQDWNKILQINEMVRFDIDRA